MPAEIMRILHVVGARPNFMKLAPVRAALARHDGVQQILIHTGQHYDHFMSDVFFRQLEIPEPDCNLDVGSDSQARQVAEIMLRLEPVILENRPDLVLVYGDVNSTVASALVCSKLLVPIGHVEAGLRSFDRTMPEEINRILTDQVADHLFTPSEDGDQNLLHEGIPREKIHLVGNVMIDTLIRLLPRAHMPGLHQELTSGKERYMLVTLHRPSNVDDPGELRRILGTLSEIAADVPVVFPVHPRTRQAIREIVPGSLAPDLRLIDPIGYLEFLSLQREAVLVITDSGGIQEETTFLGVPCLTVRENTERPVTVTVGTNILVGRDMDLLRMEANRVLSGKGKTGTIPPFWDGKAAERIAAIIMSRISG
jgi:UDP-N-acetylglucosamine 2-epimerase (non-hydrolysing)